MPASRLTCVALALALALPTRLCADDGDEATPRPARPRVTAVDAAEEEGEKDPTTPVLDDDAWRETLESLATRAAARGHDALAAHLRSWEIPALTDRQVVEVVCE